MWTIICSSYSARIAAISASVVAASSITAKQALVTFYTGSSINNDDSPALGFVSLADLVFKHN